MVECYLVARLDGAKPIDQKPAYRMENHTVFSQGVEAKDRLETAMGQTGHFRDERHPEKFCVKRKPTKRKVCEADIVRDFLLITFFLKDDYGMHASA